MVETTGQAWRSGSCLGQPRVTSAGGLACLARGVERWLGWDHFLVRGCEKVRGGMAFLVHCYNFRRLLSLFGVAGLIALCRAQRNAGADGEMVSSCVSACSPGCSSASMSRSGVLLSVFATPSLDPSHHALLMLRCAGTRGRAARSRERRLARSRCHGSGQPGSVRFSWEVVWCVAQGKRSRIAGQVGGRHGNLRAIWACS